MKLLRKVGVTSEIWQVFIQDTTSSTGAGLTGLVFNSSGLTAYYHRDTDTTATAISLATMTVGTFTSGGFKEIDSTNMPGWYQFCPTNASLASGAKSCGFHLQGAANMAPLPIEVDLAAQVDVTHWNGTAVKSPSTAGVPEVRLTGTITHGASDVLFRLGSSTSTSAIYVTNNAASGHAVLFEATGSAAVGLKLSGSGTGAGGMDIRGPVGGAAVQMVAGNQYLGLADDADGSAIFGYKLGSDNTPVMHLDGSGGGNVDAFKLAASGTGKDINLAGSQSIAGYLTGVASPTFAGRGAAVDVIYVNAIQVDGSGTLADPWGPQ